MVQENYKVFDLIQMKVLNIKHLLSQKQNVLKKTLSLLKNIKLYLEHKERPKNDITGKSWIFTP